MTKSTDKKRPAGRRSAKRTRPLLSIITVCRNSAETISRTFDSVREQAFRDFEYIVIDGASTDGTLDIVRANEDLITKWISEPDGGLYDAMNKGIALSKGRYIHVLNSDDLYFSPQTLSDLTPRLEEQSVNFGQLVYIDANGRERRLGAPFSWERELRMSHVPQPTLVVARKLYDEVGPFDLRYKIVSDYDMVLRLARRYPVNYIDVPMTVMHAGGLSYRDMGRTFREAAAVSRSHGRSALGVWMTYLARMARWQATRILPSWLLHPLRKLFSHGWR